MAAKRFLAIGECMIEMASADGALWRLGYAGDTLNLLWYARACLDPAQWRTDYFTCLGKDQHSAAMRAFMRDNGIETGHVRIIADRRPGLYLIHQQDGDRHFTYWRDNSAAKLLADDEDALERTLAQSDAIAFSGITLAILSPDRRAALLALLGAARGKGKRVAFDPNYRPLLWPDAGTAREAIMAAAAVSDILLPTFDDDRALFGDANRNATAARYLAAGACEVVVKDGARPALVAGGGETGDVPALSVGEPVDATGAGDSFNGAYLAGRLRDLPAAEAAAAGHAVAGQVIRHRGALIPMGELKTPFPRANANT